MIVLEIELRNRYHCSRLVRVQFKGRDMILVKLPKAPWELPTELQKNTFKSCGPTPFPSLRLRKPLRPIWACPKGACPPPKYNRSCIMRKQATQDSFPFHCSFFPRWRRRGDEKMGPKLVLAGFVGKLYKFSDNRIL